MDRLRGQQGWAGSPGRAGWPQAPGQGRLGAGQARGRCEPLLLLTASPGSPHCLFQVTTPRPPPPPITAGGPWGPALGVRGQHLLKGTLRSLCSWGPWSPPWTAPWSQDQLPLPLGAPHPPRLTIYPPTAPEPPRAKRRTRATRPAPPLTPPLSWEMWPRSALPQRYRQERVSFTGGSEPLYAELMCPQPFLHAGGCSAFLSCCQSSDVDNTIIPILWMKKPRFGALRESLHGPPSRVCCSHLGAPVLAS